MPLRVLVVEDSATQGRALERILQAEGDIVVVAVVPDCELAVVEAARHRPDVITMDLDIPNGGGQRAIERIMHEAPAPILVLSGLLDRGERAVRALAAGAVDALPKPDVWTDRHGLELRRHVRRVGAVPVIRRRAPGRILAPLRRPSADGPVVAIAASTGGPAALSRVVAGLAGVPAPVLVVQHIHPSFAEGFAEWLSSASGRNVHMAADGGRAEPGCVYVAPGDRHLLLGRNRTLRLESEPATLHRPSADVLFASLAQVARSAGIGVLLTGMGDDGTKGLLALRKAGGAALAQDQASSAVFGMPGSAHRAGAAEELVPLERVADRIREAVRERC